MFGALVINSVCYGTSGLQGNRAWRIPLGLFYIVPTIVASLIFFIPESPRWLLRKNRPEEAMTHLRRLRQGIFSEEEIEREYDQLRVSLESEPETNNVRFVELFQGTNLKRTFIVIVVNFFMQASGQAFASQYGAIYVKTLGIINPFGFALTLVAVNIVTLIGVLLWADLCGRRYVHEESGSFDRGRSGHANMPTQDSSFHVIGRGGYRHAHNGRLGYSGNSNSRPRKGHRRHDRRVRLRLLDGLGPCDLHLNDRDILAQAARLDLASGFCDKRVHEVSPLVRCVIRDTWPGQLTSLVSPSTS